VRRCGGAHDRPRVRDPWDDRHGCRDHVLRTPHRARDAASAAPARVAPAPARRDTGRRATGVLRPSRCLGLGVELWVLLRTDDRQRARHGSRVAALTTLCFPNADARGLEVAARGFSHRLALNPASNALSSIVRLGMLVTLTGCPDQNPHQLWLAPDIAETRVK